MLVKISKLDARPRWWEECSDFLKHIYFFVGVAGCSPQKKDCYSSEFKCMWEFIHHLLGSMRLLKSVSLLTYCNYFVTFQTSLWRVKGDYSSPNLSFHQSPLIMLWGSSPLPKWATWNCVLDCFCNGFVISCLITVSSSQEPEQEPDPLDQRLESRAREMYSHGASVWWQVYYDKDTHILKILLTSVRWLCLSFALGK